MVRVYCREMSIGARDGIAAYESPGWGRHLRDAQVCLAVYGVLSFANAVLIVLVIDGVAAIDPSTTDSATVDVATEDLGQVAAFREWATDIGLLEYCGQQNPIFHYLH
jgi:hypothetical protein